MPTQIHYDGKTVELSDDERQALSWLAYFPSYYDAPKLRHLRAVLDRGGELDTKARASLTRDVEAAQVLLARPLEVWKPKYGSNVGMGSEAAFSLIKRHRLRYLNRNVDPPAVYIAGRKATGEPHTIGDLPEITSGLQKLAVAGKSQAARIDHEHSYEGF